MSKTSYIKGYKGEYAVRKIFEAAGFKTKWHRTDRNYPDVSVEGLLCEIKYQKAVPKRLYDWLDKKKTDFLAIRRVSKEEKRFGWLVVMRMDLFLKLLVEYFKK